MPPKPDWTFPDLPAFLSGLTLDHLARLRALVRTHGLRLGSAPTGDVHVLKLRLPISVFLTVIGSEEDAVIIVIPPDEVLAPMQANIALAPGGPTKLTWSPNIALQDLLDCLDADAVIKTSQLAKTGKDGSN